jgi:hypothetical protein
MDTGLSHAVTERISAPADAVFRFLSDGRNLGRWAFGCWETREVEPGLFVGHSLFDGSACLVRVVADAATFAVWFHVGTAADGLVPRIVAHVVPGEQTGRGAQESLMTLLAWRDATMSDDRWRRVAVGHETEALLIKALIERAV